MKILKRKKKEADTNFILLSQSRNMIQQHFVKSVRIRSYSGPHFPAFGLNISEYGHVLRSVMD